MLQELHPRQMQTQRTRGVRAAHPETVINMEPARHKDGPHFASCTGGQADLLDTERVDIAPRHLADTRRSTEHNRVTSHFRHEESSYPAHDM